MLAARPSTIPGRRHKMVFVDCSNPYTRDYIRRYAGAHGRFLDGVTANVARWAAASRGREAEAEGRQPRPLAAVFDIDEVILSNIHMNSFRGVQGGLAVDFHAADYFAGPDGQPWPRGHRLNPLLPGARELLVECLSAGLAVFFVTGRVESIRDETVENFAHVGLTDLFPAAELARTGGGPPWMSPPMLQLCPDAEKPAPGESIRPFKEARRRAIEQTHRIVFNIGDQISDLGLHGDVQVHDPHVFYWTP